MNDDELIVRMTALHWRLRLRNPATKAEIDAWSAIRQELDRRGRSTQIGMLPDNLQDSTMEEERERTKNNGPMLSHSQPNP